MVLREVSPGIIPLLIPMESAYRQANENKRTKFVILEYLQRWLYYVQGKINMYIKRIGYVQGNNYVHKKNWDLHREGGPWSIKKFEEKLVRFYLQIELIMEKGV